MAKQLYDFGMVGLGVMGRNFLLNVADNGYSIIGLDTSKEQAKALEEEAAGKVAKGTTDMKEFVACLKKPRKIMLLVPAGKVVDIVIKGLLNHVEAGDLIIDGGNSFFEDTDRRLASLKKEKVQRTILLLVSMMTLPIQVSTSINHSALKVTRLTGLCFTD